MLVKQLVRACNTRGEIALLNHGVSNPEKVDEVATRLTSSIAATMEDWGLGPQVRHDAE